MVTVEISPKIITVGVVIILAMCGGIGYAIYRANQANDIEIPEKTPEKSPDTLYWENVAMMICVMGATIHYDNGEYQYHVPDGNMLTKAIAPEPGIVKYSEKVKIFNYTSSGFVIYMSGTQTVDMKIPTGGSTWIEYGVY